LNPKAFKTLDLLFEDNLFGKVFPEFFVASFVIKKVSNHTNKKGCNNAQQNLPHANPTSLFC